MTNDPPRKPKNECRMPSSHAGRRGRRLSQDGGAVTDRCAMNVEQAKIKRGERRGVSPTWTAPRVYAISGRRPTSGLRLDARQANLTWFARRSVVIRNSLLDIPWWLFNGSLDIGHSFFPFALSASTQNQALSAIVFLYRDVLELELGPLDAVRARPIAVSLPAGQVFLTFICIWQSRPYA